MAQDHFTEPTNHRFWIAGALGILLLLLAHSLYFPVTTSNNRTTPPVASGQGSPADIEIDELSKIDRKKARGEYFMRLMRDPATGQVPAGVRDKELSHARSLQDKISPMLRKATADFDWEEIGPYNIGGRTRALAVDQTDNDVIIAGGVSGGIWKSTDRGQSWEMKTMPSQNMSVTSLAQDPRDGHTDTWYYSAGEFWGNSASARSARYYGTGIFKSTDNGETWQRLESTLDKDKGFSGAFDYTSRIRIHPGTGNVFLASNGFGILRSTDGQNFATVLGGRGEHLYTDVEVGPNGKLAAALSTVSAGVENDTTGILISNDNGDTWTNVTPDNFPDSHERTVLAFAPSNPDILYTFSYLSGEGENEQVAFFKLNLANGTAEDRSANMPDFNINRGYVNTQAGYNMVLEVKPDNPDFVLLGATNLFRSKDGFATEPSTTDKNDVWIGGYGNGSSAGSDGTGSYPNQHADQHAIVFDPTNPDRVWTGHDGGLSLTEDITATPVEWEDMNNGYNVTQYYTIDLPDVSGDDRIIGGTQDNGSPFFRYSNNNQRNSAYDAFGGDGAFAQFAIREGFDINYLFLSSQNGNTYRTTLSGFTGTPSSSNFTEAKPQGAENPLFIHPSALDPATKNVLYYPGERVMWRNPEVLNDAGNWNKLDSINVPQNYRISSLAVSKQPANVLYYAGYSQDQAPVMYRLDNAHQDSTGKIDVSIDAAESGTWIHTIDINPNNADEAIVAISNYRVTSIYHTTNGGDSWTAVEGNLDDEAQDRVGPSVRTVKILPLGNGDKVYLAGTSTGLYATGSLSGSTTEWVHQSENQIGYSVIEAMDVRPSDGLVAAATHGRGIFLGTHSTFTDISEAENSSEPESFKLAGNYPNPFNPSTNISFTLPTASEVTVTVYNSNGQEVQTLVAGQTFRSGRHQLSFNGSNLASGTYIYRIEARATGTGRTFTDTRTMTLVK